VQRSNAYIIIFTAIMTIVVGGLLSLASQILGPAQKKSIELDTKSQILNAVMVIGKEDDVLGIYDKRISSLVVDAQGNLIESDEKGQPMIAENVNVLRNFKKEPKDRLLPVFRFMNEEKPGEVQSYIIPVYGNGLWDKIWGFIAIDSQLETIIGISLAHKSETPGLGARISSPDIQNRYKGKEMYDRNGALVSVVMMKGEKGGGEASIQAFTDQPHKVDGMSGATLTGNGVNSMLKEYLEIYQGYFNKVKSAEPI